MVADIFHLESNPDTILGVMEVHVINLTTNRTR
jgi:hypothetical protein